MRRQRPPNNFTRPSKNMYNFYTIRRHAKQRRTLSLLIAICISYENFRFTSVIHNKIMILTLSVTKSILKCSPQNLIDRISVMFYISKRVNTN